MDYKDWLFYIKNLPVEQQNALCHNLSRVSGLALELVAEQGIEFERTLEGTVGEDIIRPLIVEGGMWRHIDSSILDLRVALTTSPLCVRYRIIRGADMQHAAPQSITHREVTTFFNKQRLHLPSPVEALLIPATDLSIGRGNHSLCAIIAGTDATFILTGDSARRCLVCRPGISISFSLECYFLAVCT